MWPGAETLELSGSVFTIMRDLIRENAGLYYDDSRREILAEKLSDRVRAQGFRSYLDYYYLLKYDPAAESEWPCLLDALSVPETYFWREIGQVNALVDTILPKLVQSRPQAPVDIWCAACATGEEPLTIAMALAEAGWWDRAPIRIKASDASPSAIEKARRGIFRERSFRCLSRPLREKYFSPTEGGEKISPELHGRISWSCANLVNDQHVEPLVHVSIIFCRNVFIYFSPDTVAGTIRRFARGMIRPGYLFVGASESLLKITDEFELEQFGEAFVYFLPPTKGQK